MLNFAAKWYPAPKTAVPCASVLRRCMVQHVDVLDHLHVPILSDGRKLYTCLYCQ
jgi:hypothetical protein